MVRIWTFFVKSDPDLLSKFGFWALGIRNHQVDVTLACDDDQLVPLTILSSGTAFSDISFKYIFYLNNKRPCFSAYIVIVRLFTNKSGFYGSSLENCNIGSRFSLVFLKFWSGFSLDFTLLSLEYKVSWVWHDYLFAPPPPTHQELYFQSWSNINQCHLKTTI